MKTKKISHIRKFTKRIFVFGILSLCAIIVTLGTIIKVVLQIVDKYQEAVNLDKALVSLQEEERELTNEVSRLEDPDYLARYAREKYFYSKEDEIIIRIPTE